LHEDNRHTTAAEDAGTGAPCRSGSSIANQQELINEKLGVATSAALAHLALRHRVIGTIGA
jgi:hypothetical protein